VASDDCSLLCACSVVARLSRICSEMRINTERQWDGVNFCLPRTVFFHGLVTWPFLTLGTAFQLLSMALLVRYLNAPKDCWLVWLTVTCLVSTLMHPFEIVVTLTAARVVVLLRQFGLSTRTVARLSPLTRAAGMGMLPYVLQTLRIPWLHEVARANMLQTMPAPCC
jgi:hypothetical protein